MHHFRPAMAAPRGCRRLLLGLLAALLATTSLAAAPVRVMLEPIPYAELGALASLNFRVIVAHYLRERLVECPELALVSDERGNAIWRELTTAARPLPPAQWFAAAHAVLPLDLLLTATATDDEVALVLHRRDGETVLRAATGGTPARPWRTVVREVMPRLAKELALAPASAAALTADRLPDPAGFAACYLAKSLSVSYPRNPGGERVQLLRPVLPVARTQPQLAAGILNGTYQLLTATRREQSFAASAMAMAPSVLPAVLGTPFEASALPLVALQPAAFEKDLLDLAKPLSGDVFDAGGDDLGGGDDAGALVPGGGREKVTVPVARRLGALRVLGATKSPAALALLTRAARNDDPQVREATAHALQHFTEQAGVGLLQALVADKVKPVAFRAALSLRARNLAAPALAELARGFLNDPAADRRRPAAAIVGAAATAADVPLLRPLADATDPAVRRAAVAALQRLAALTTEDVLRFADDPDDEVVLAALAGPLPAPADALIPRLRQLANDPLDAVAEAARQALTPLRPTETHARQRFDLEIEHPYLREQIVRALAAPANPDALADLTAAAANAHAHVRALALRLLGERFPAEAPTRWLAALADPHRWVRLHAAVLLAGAASPAAAERLRAAVTAERDPAIRLWLDDALARAEGRPPPAPPPAAHSVAGKRNLSWLCGVGLDSANSPFDAYYCLSLNVSDSWRAAHAAGKVLFARIEPVGNPGAIIVSNDWRDRFWLAIDGQLPAASLSVLDGVVYGEETMSMAPDALWADGWRLFCLDAGIDPVRIAGRREALTPPELGAWRSWAGERCVEGFNLLYQATKLRAGKLRPGLQVATFLPGDSGDLPAAARWQFDVGGVYDYKCDSRMSGYNLVRRYQTLWPERPIIWLSFGVGGYEMNPVKRTQKVPGGPIFWRNHRCYADSVTAWLAGADAGWFSIWIWVEKDFGGGMMNLRGVTTLPEDLLPDSPVLQRAIAYSFQGAAEDHADKPATAPTAKTPELSEEEDFGDLDQPAQAAAKAQAVGDQIAADKERFRLGYNFYRQYVYDCARVFADLPRQRYRAPALYVRPGTSVWTMPTTPHPLVPGEALLSRYDFLGNLNHVTDVGLAGYRLLVVRDPGALRDSTIAAVTEWLRKQPGVLYISRQLAADNAAEAATTADHDGKLDRDWPWEADVQIAPLAKPAALKALSLTGPAAPLAVAGGVVSSHFTVAGKDAATILSHDGAPCLVVWRRPGEFKGAVVFDGVESASKEYLVHLRALLQKLHADHGVGLPLDGPALVETLATPELSAAAATSYYRAAQEPRRYPGIDLLSGEADPEVGTGRAGAIVAPKLTGKWVAARPGLVAMGERPLEDVRDEDGGLGLKCAGLVRAAAGVNAVTVKTADGSPLPVITEDVPRWLVEGAGPGLVVWPLGPATAANPRTITYFRTPARVLLVVAPPPAAPALAPAAAP